VYAVLERASVKHDVKFCDQMRDSARGGPRAIAEGFGRFRPADFARYLDYARGSLIETQNHLDDALDCRYLEPEEHASLYRLADRTIGATTSLHRYLSSCSARQNQKPKTRNPEP
jgi:four helix bundle protein